MNNMIADLAVPLLRVDGQDPQGLFLGVVIGVNNIRDQFSLSLAT